MFLMSPSVTKAQAVHRSKSPLNTTRVLAPENRRVVEQALARLRVLRDGWNDVNRQFIKQSFVAAQRLDSRVYEVQYLEAKAAVSDALYLLPKGELRSAIAQAMDLFDDLEAITKIYDQTTLITTNVRVTDVFPYLKKYNVPYESGVTRGSSSLMLHQDFVLSYILPLRFARVNRIEVLLGGKAQPTPPPPTYEQMFRVPKPPPALDPSSVHVEDLKEVIHQAIQAKLRGDSARVAALLDDSFVLHGIRGLEWDKGRFLKAIALDPTVKSFELAQAELSIRGNSPVVTTKIKYQSFTEDFKSSTNTFTFVNRGGKWLITRWNLF